MVDSFIHGLALVVGAGACQGSFMLPTKWIKGWVWENYWLVFASTAYLACPWILALATIPRLFEVYEGTSAGSLAAIAVYGTGWGIGALTFGLAVEALGLALGFAVILGVAATTGAVVPLLVQPPQGFSFVQGALTASSLALMVGGVAVCSLAGRWKEGAGARSYRRGLLIAIASGLLSACGNLGFAFGSEITERAEQLGVPEALAPNALWTLLTLPLFLCNAVYALLLLRKNDSSARFSEPAAGRNFALGAAMGLLWMSGFALYGAGARKLGDLGPSLGWAILMSTMVLAANLSGLLTGEWNAAPRQSKRQLAFGVLLLLVAIAGLGCANAVGSRQ
jgi:L-rhamnose-H+ transport protein